MSNGEYEVLSAKIDNVLTTLSDFKKDSKDQLGDIHDHLKMLNGRMGEQETNAALLAQADENIEKTIDIKTKTSKVMWLTITVLSSTVTGLAIYLLTKS